MFQDVFYNQIAQLLYTFPADHTTESGQLFWSGLKRLPKIVEFDSTDPTHVEFVFSAANLWAYVFALSPLTNKEEVAAAASKVHVKEFNPKKVVIKESDKDTKVEMAEDDETRIVELTQQLLSTKISNERKTNTIEFEKDDDTNFHIDFISAVANLRARNYSIEEVPRHKVKLIAGKIIPAIATATAMIVGIVGFEIFKYIAGKKINVFRNAFCNLAIPMWVLSDPLPPVRNKDKDMDPILLGPIKAIPPGWTNWDKIDIQGPKSFEAIFKEIKERYSVVLNMVAIGEIMVYSAGMTKAERLKLTPEEAFKAIKGVEYNPLRRYIELTVSGETFDGVDAFLPLVRYRRGDK